MVPIPCISRLCPPSSLSCAQLDLESNELGPEGAAALAPAIAVCASVTSATLLANRFDDATVGMLLKLKEEKPTLMTLCSLKPDQTEANFNYCSLTPQDAKLLTPEILVHPSVTRVDVRYNEIAGDGASQLSAAVLSNAKIEVFNEIPIKEMRTDSLTELNLFGKNIGTVGAMVVAGLLPAMASLTSVR